MTELDYIQLRNKLIEYCKPANYERCSLDRAFGRILAEDLYALDNVPAFDRSPYDGYAVLAADTVNASPDNPVCLAITEEIAAGDVPSIEIKSGFAAKILTGAPIPKGADAVIMYEETELTQTDVKVFKAVKPSDNIVYAGEDVRKGQLLVRAGHPIDAGTAASLAAQGILEPLVYKRPKAAYIATGNELVDNCEELEDGKILNTNRYSISAALEKDGCEVLYYGIADDGIEFIKDKILMSLLECDFVVLTGGVSKGDYDLTDKAMIEAGVEIVQKGVDIKPGMACCYGEKNGKLVCALSGNPASSLTNYYAIFRPVVRKIAGLSEYIPETISCTLAEAFNKKSKSVRFLRGKLDLNSGKVLLHISPDQGNVIISSAIGNDFMAEVPAGSDKLSVGTELKGFII